MFKSIFYSLSNPLLLVNEHGIIIASNKSIELLLKKSRRELKNSNLIDLVEASKTKEIQPLIQKVIKRAASNASFETELKNGEMGGLPAKLIITPVENKRDNIILIKVIELGEERKEIRALKINDRLKEIGNDMLEGVQLINNKWEYLYLNDTAVEQSQFEREFLIGKSMPEIYPGIEKTKLFRELKHCFTDQKPRIIDNEFKFPNGITCWFKLSIQPMGNVLFILSNDITELQRAKVLLKEQNKDLKTKNLELLKFQSKLLSAQISPHFIFNVLSSVQACVLSQEIEPALVFISDFSKLMRKVLDNSMHTYITLSNAVEFLELYLGLEQKRMSDKFTFSIELSDEIDPDEVLIPPLLLQPYVENALIHGIGYLKNGGKVKLIISQKNDNLHCKIIDNGLGRKKVGELNQAFEKETKSWAMKLCKKRLGILSEIQERDYHVKFKDVLNSDGSVGGTEVDLALPLIEA